MAQSFPGYLKGHKLPQVTYFNAAIAEMSLEPYHKYICGTHPTIEVPLT
jgi:hypothetical protein